MTDNQRLQQLLDELLNSPTTPEEVCASCPELLPEVRRRWGQIRRIQGELDALFPASSEQVTSPSAVPPPPGGTLPDVPQYRVEGVLGHGGMGVVYRAFHLRLHRHVALKMLLVKAHAPPTDRERFEREAEAVAALRHPNIVQIYEVGDASGQPYFTMELVEGGSLADRIQGVPQPARRAVELVAPLAEAVHVAHQCGIVHRDLKPGNILLAADGTPKITDFGLAWRLDGSEGLTLSGALVGTPSYMAPEQARGDKGAVGPATDVYALGTILYELLTGRPPFRAESPTATLQQVVADEPVPPARLNPRVSRDLQTICLKCLYKEPDKRYASAQALAEDLRRFEQGEPIKARPESSLECAARWARRRPALAGTLVSGALLALALVATVVWWHGERTALEATAVAYATADLSESERLRDRGEFQASAAVLRRAKDRLGDYVPPELRDNLATDFANLELVTRLDAIRLERALVNPRSQTQAPAELLGVLSLPRTQDFQDGQAFDPQTSSGQHYQEVLLEAGIGAPGEDPVEVAMRVRASPVRSALVSALDDWSACAADREQQAWVLAVVRHADPDSWRDRARDPATWDDPAALRELADQAAVAEQSPQLLAMLGARLRAKKLDAVGFLGQVSAAYPSDFWVNVEMGNALCDQSNLGEAIGYYRTALALRPNTAALRYVLGDLHLAQRRWDGAIAEYKQALRLDPENPLCHNRLGFTLAWKGGHDDEAIAQFQEAVRIDANNGWSHFYLAIALEHKGRLSESVDEFRQAERLLPEKRFEVRGRRHGMMLKLGRGGQVKSEWKQDLAARPPHHDDWFGYAELCLFLGDVEEYRRARSDLLAQFGSTTDPTFAERTGRACLLLPAAEDELRQAVELTARAVAAGRQGHEFAYPFRLFAQGLALYRAGRFDEAMQLMKGDAASVMGPSPRLILAMAQYQQGREEEARQTLSAAVASYDWSEAEAINHDIWIGHILRREAEALILSNQPAVGASEGDNARSAPGIVH